MEPPVLGPGASCISGDLRLAGTGGPGGPDVASPGRRLARMDAVLVTALVAVPLALAAVALRATLRLLGLPGRTDA